MTLPNTISPTQGVNANSYEWILDLAVLSETPSWLNAPDITAVQPNVTPKTADGTTYANKGQDDITTIGESFTTTYDAKIVKNSQGEVMPVIGLLLDAANAHLPGGNPARKVIMARLYHHSIAELAWEFTAEVSWTRRNTGNADNEFLSVTLTSKGDRKVIANPALGPVAAPTVTGAEPGSVAEGDWVQIEGTGFVSVSSVKFGDAQAETVVTANGGLLFAQMPAGEAGSAAIVVTTPAGGNAPFSYTRGA